MMHFSTRIFDPITGAQAALCPACACDENNEPRSSIQHLHSTLTFKTTLRCLTSHVFSTNIDRMTELETLEQKLMQLVQLHQQARAENRELRNRVTQLEGENRALADKMTSARDKLESLIDRIPATEEA